jgi:hypothetical protein
MSLAVVANRHRSPVLSVWADIVEEERQQEEGGQKDVSAAEGGGGAATCAEEQELEEAVQEEQCQVQRANRHLHQRTQAFVRSRNRWQLALSLLNNPSLIAMRAGRADSTADC